jgi:hypothetical protein
MEKRIIAFLDILGFKNYIKRLSKEPELANIIAETLLDLKKLENEDITLKLPYGKEVKFRYNFKASAFSDSIVLSAATDDFESMFFKMQSSISKLILKGIFVRGGITVGDVYHENRIVYGQGMINAYEIENKLAIYPRILLDKKAYNLVSKKSKDSLITGISSNEILFAFKKQE